jgi:hypothetical protein
MIVGFSFLKYPQEAIEMEIPLLFQGITVLGLVWRRSSIIEGSPEDFLWAAVGKLDSFRAWMKTKGRLAENGAPQLQLLAYI